MRSPSLASTHRWTPSSRGRCVCPWRRSASDRRLRRRRAQQQARLLLTRAHRAQPRPRQRPLPAAVVATPTWWTPTTRRRCSRPPSQCLWPTRQAPRALPLRQTRLQLALVQQRAAATSQWPTPRTTTKRCRQRSPCRWQRASLPRRRLRAARPRRSRPEASRTTPRCCRIRPLCSRCSDRCQVSMSTTRGSRLRWLRRRTARATIKGDMVRGATLVSDDSLIGGAYALPQMLRTDSVWLGRLSCRQQ
mmetsp:Transcript_23510/g.60474  ORF Transcript_23510/g.60474 Transcript_23510/m.60474 type:complete len:248 (-) Transcript_23510:160-903(-)